MLKFTGHFEVSLRSQQMLENFIEGNQRQMQTVLNEVNRVGNIALHNTQRLRILERRSWKNLRKFYSYAQLKKDHHFKYYPHLSRTFSRDDRAERPNPKLPPLNKIDEVIHVNAPDDRIAPEVDSGSSRSSADHEDSDVDLFAPDNEDYASPPSSDADSSGEHSSSGESSPASGDASNA